MLAGVFSTLAECGQRCGPTCHSYGETIDKSGVHMCMTCGGQIVSSSLDGVCANHSYVGNTFGSAVAVGGGCTGRVCNVCNDTDLSALPLSPILYVHACGEKFKANGAEAANTIELDFAGVQMTQGLDIFVQATDTLILKNSTGGLVVHGNFSIRSTVQQKQGVVPTVIVPASEASECAVTVHAVAQTPMHVHVQNVDVYVDAECAFCIADTTVAKGRMSTGAGSITWQGGEFFPPTGSYGMAIAGVHATIEVQTTVNTPAGILTLDTHDPSSKTTAKSFGSFTHVDVSALLAVFGTAYEIEYWCATSNKPKACLSKTHAWVKQANAVLLVIVILLGTAVLANPARLSYRRVLRTPE